MDAQQIEVHQNKLKDMPKWCNMMACREFDSCCDVSYRQWYVGALKDNRPADAPWSTQHVLLTVESLMQVQFAWATYADFYTIITNYNWQLAVDVACFDVGSHIKVAKYEVMLLKLTLIRPYTKL